MKNVLSFLYPNHNDLGLDEDTLLESWALTNLHLFFKPEYEKIVMHFIKYAKDYYMDYILEVDPTREKISNDKTFSEDFHLSLFRDIQERVDYIEKNIEYVIKYNVQRYYTIVLGLSDKSKEKYSRILRLCVKYNNQRLLFQLKDWEIFAPKLLSPVDIVHYIDYHKGIGFDIQGSKCLFFINPELLLQVMYKNIHYVPNYCCKMKYWDALSYITQISSILSFFSEKETEIFEESYTKIFPDYEGMIYFSANCQDFMLINDVLINWVFTEEEWLDCLIISITSKNDTMVESMLVFSEILTRILEKEPYRHQILNALPLSNEVINNLMIPYLNPYISEYKKYTVRYNNQDTETMYIKPFNALSTDYQFKAFEKYFIKDIETIDYIESIPQRTTEWLNARKGMISGTGVGPALGHNMKYMPPDKFILDKLFSLFKGNDATNWGTYIEPYSEDLTFLVLKKYYYSKYLHIPFFFDTWDDGFRINSSRPWLGVSSDGHYRVYSLQNDSNGVLLKEEKGTIEIKSPYMQPTPYPECPHYYYDQFQTAAYTLNCNTIAFVIFTPDTLQLNIYEYDQPYIEYYAMPLLFHFHVTHLFPRIVLKDEGFYGDDAKSIQPSLYKIINYVDSNPSQTMFIS